MRKRIITNYTKVIPSINLNKAHEKIVRMTVGIRVYGKVRECLDIDLIDSKRVRINNQYSINNN